MTARDGYIINPPYPGRHGTDRPLFEPGPMVTLQPVAGAQIMSYSRFADRPCPPDMWHARCVITFTAEGLRANAQAAANECRRLRQEWHRMLFFGVEKKPEGIAVRRARNAARKRATALYRELARVTKPGSVCG